VKGGRGDRARIELNSGPSPDEGQGLEDGDKPKRLVWVLSITERGGKEKKKVVPTPGPDQRKYFVVIAPEEHSS